MVKVLRINRYLSLCGIASRRKCESILLNGDVSVNDEVCINLSTTVHPGRDRVHYKGKLIHPPTELSYYILHKPKGYLSSAEDPHHRKTIYLLIKDIPERVFHVGRLDKDSEGLLFLTNDGKLAHRLLHPKYQVPKEYYVEVNGFLSDGAIEKLISGVELEEGKTNPSKIDLINRSGKESQFNIVLHQGWKRQIRRMVESTGLEVTYLRRDTFGPLGLTGLSLGEWRKLSITDINRLKREVNLP